MKLMMQQPINPMFITNYCLSFLFGAFVTCAYLFAMELMNSDPIKNVINGIEAFENRVDQRMNIALVDNELERKEK